MSERLKNMLVIGITGQLATGKSTVAAMFAEKGAHVINADLIAHRALRPHGACFSKVVKKFGKDIVNQGEIDRRKLAEIVFKKPRQLRKLEQIIHPFVLKEIRSQVASLRKGETRIVVLDVPLLFESKMDRYVDLTIAVKASLAVQMKRVLKQGRFDRGEALRRMHAQLPMREKARRADIIINNNGTLAQTKKQIQDIWKMLNRRYK